MKTTINDLKLLEGEELNKAIDEISKEIICDGYSALSNSAKTKHYRIKLIYSEEIFCFYQKPKEPYYGGQVKNGHPYMYTKNAVVDSSIPLDKDMVEFFKKSLMNEVLELQNIQSYRELFKLIIFKDGVCLLDLLEDMPIRYGYGGDPFNIIKGDTPYFHKILWAEDFYKKGQEIIYFELEQKKILKFDIENIIIQSIELGSNFNTLKIRTNFEEINFKVKDDGYSNDIIHTNDQCEDFIGKKIRGITISKSADNDYEFLKIQTTENEWLTFNLYQEEYYSSGFECESVIFQYFKKLHKEELENTNL